MSKPGTSQHCAVFRGEVKTLMQIKQRKTLYAEGAPVVSACALLRLPSLYRSLPHKVSEAADDKLSKIGFPSCGYAQRLSSSCALAGSSTPAPETSDRPHQPTNEKRGTESCAGMKIPRFSDQCIAAWMASLNWLGEQFHMLANTKAISLAFLAACGPRLNYSAFLKTAHAPLLLTVVVASLDSGIGCCEA